MDMHAPMPEAWRKQFLASRMVGARLFAVQRFAFTHGLLADVCFQGTVTYEYTARYCYPAAADALKALQIWDGIGDPPGDWAKEKVSGRLGPALLKDDARKTAPSRRGAASTDKVHPPSA